MTTNIAPTISGNLRTENSVFFRKDNDSELVSPSSPDEFLPQIALWTSLGGLLMISLFGTAISLSNIFKYKVTVQAAAAIRPMGELRIVQSAIEGSIASINVKENQAVKQGDIIATLNDSKLQTKLVQLEGDIQKGQQQIIAIDSQVFALNRQVAAETEQSNRNVAGVRTELLRYQREYRDKQITSRAEVAEAEANFMTAERETQAAEVELFVGSANLKSLEAASKAAIAKRDRYQSAATAGAISQNLLEEAQLAAEQQAQSIAGQQATINKQKQIIAQLKYAAKAAKAREQRAFAAIAPSKAEMAGIGEKIARERATGNAAIARLQKEREQLFQQQGEIRSQIQSSKSEIAQINIELKGTIVRASSSGIIQELSLRNNSQVVRQGDLVAKIAPNDAPVTIEAAVSSGDINKVKVGQIVQMRVSACPYPDYGILTGKVSQISPDVKQPTREKDGDSPRQRETAPAPTYAVKITPDTTMLKSQAAKCPIQPGMDGRVDIISKEETVLQFVLRTTRILVTP